MSRTLGYALWYPHELSHILSRNFRVLGGSKTICFKRAVSHTSKSLYFARQLSTGYRLWGCLIAQNGRNILGGKSTTVRRLCFGTEAATVAKDYKASLQVPCCPSIICGLGVRRFQYGRIKVFLASPETGTRCAVRAASDSKHCSMEKGGEKLGSPGLEREQPPTAPTAPTAPMLGFYNAVTG